MSYTIEDLDAAVAAGEYLTEDDERDEAGDQEGYGSLYEKLISTSVYKQVAEDYPGAKQGVSRGEPYWYTFFDVEPVADLPGIGRATLLEDFGGEGQGDQYWFIFEVVDSGGNKRFFRRDGWYASYDGGYYEGPTEEVSPVERMITVWEKV